MLQNGIAYVLIMENVNSNAYQMIMDYVFSLYYYVYRFDVYIRVLSFYSLPIEFALNLVLCFQRLFRLAHMI